LSGLNLLIVPYIFSYPESQQYLLKNFPYLNFFGQLPVFVSGIFCYLTFRENYPRRQIIIVGGFLFVVFLLAFLYPSFKLPSHFVADKLFKLPHHFIAGGLFSIFALLLANWPIQPLVNSITTALGKLSFSMYLTHFAILTCFSRLGFSDIFPKSNIASILHFLCVVFVAAVISLFFYKYIEIPGVALGKRLIEKLEQNGSL
jgi:peptidoglycan/LPS O-acetylase OafA/YrhL